MAHAPLTLPALSNPRMSTFVSFRMNSRDHSVENVTAYQSLPSWGHHVPHLPCSVLEEKSMCAWCRVITSTAGRSGIKSASPARKGNWGLGQPPGAHQYITAPRSTCPSDALPLLYSAKKQRLSILLCVTPGCRSRRAIIRPASLSLKRFVALACRKELHPQLYTSSTTRPLFQALSPRLPPLAVRKTPLHQLFTHTLRTMSSAAPDPLAVHAPTIPSAIHPPVVNTPQHPEDSDEDEEMPLARKAVNGARKRLEDSASSEEDKPLVSLHLHPPTRESRVINGATIPAFHLAAS